MSTKRPWILTESQKACIHVHECALLGEPSFPWTYMVDVGGFTYPGKHTHPTRRSAWAAGKSYFKSLSESKGLRDGPMVAMVGDSLPSDERGNCIEFAAGEILDKAKYSRDFVGYKISPITLTKDNIHPCAADFKNFKQRIDDFDNSDSAIKDEILRVCQKLSSEKYSDGSGPAVSRC